MFNSLIMGIVLNRAKAIVAFFLTGRLSPRKRAA